MDMLLFDKITATPAGPGTPVAPDNIVAGPAGQATPVPPDNITPGPAGWVQVEPGGEVPFISGPDNIPHEMRVGGIIHVVA